GKSPFRRDAETRHARRVRYPVDSRQGNAHCLGRARSSSALNGGNSTDRFFQDSSRAWACAPLTSCSKQQARPPMSTSSPEGNFLGSARKPLGAIVSRINCHSRFSCPGSTKGIGS